MNINPEAMFSSRFLVPFQNHESIDIPTHIISEEESADELNDRGIRRSRLAQDLTSQLMTKTLSNVSSLSARGSKLSVDVPIDTSFVPLARAHWILLGKAKDQISLCRSMLSYVIINYPQTRPMWQFVKDVDFSDETWIDALQKDTRFR